MTDSLIRDAIDIQINQERLRQDEKWGVQNHDPFTYLAILGEEVGESNQAALEAHTWEVGQKGNKWKSLEHYREELIQVAAVAKAMIECVDRNVNSDWELTIE